MKNRIFSSQLSTCTLLTGRTKLKLTNLLAFFFLTRNLSHINVFRGTPGKVGVQLCLPKVEFAFEVRLKW